MEKKTYLLFLTQNRKRRVTVPATWKLTFGMVAPGKAGGSSNYDGSRGWCLRFYEGTDKVRAVFTDVRSFYEVGGELEIVEQKTKTTRRVLNSDQAGLSKGSVVEARVSQWVDPEVGESSDDQEESLRVHTAITAGMEDEETF